jgi:cytochrome c-type biogenesis protein
MDFQLPLVSIAFLAGVLSFISPCVLPLVPAYISYMGVRAGEQTRPGDLALAGSNGGQVAAVPLNRTTLFLHGTMFVLGLTFVFVFFGLTVNVGLRLIGVSSYDLQIWTARIGGVLVIIFALQVLGVWGWIITQLVKRTSSDSPLGIVLQRIQSVLYADTRRQMKRDERRGYVGSFLMGVFFAAGWTPCIGPTYGSILTFAANVSVSGAVVPLLAYSLGIGLPFLLAAIGLDRIRPFFRRLQKRQRMVELVSGVLLLFMGYLLLSGRLAEISAAANQSNLATYQYRLEECTVAAAEGKITNADHGRCMEKGLTDARRFRVCENAIAAGEILPSFVDGMICGSSREPDL